jgi:hypothetical protein
MTLGSIGRWYRPIPWYGSGKLWLVDVHGQGRRSLSLSVFFDVFHRFWTGDEAVWTRRRRRRCNLHATDAIHTAETLS